MFTKDEIGFIGIIVAGIAGLIGIIANRKINRVAETIDRTVDDLSKKDISVDIAQEFVEKAATRKIDGEIEKMMPSVKRDAIRVIQRSFEEAIQKEINMQYQDTKAEVKRALQQRVGSIDISDVKREVISDAKEAAEEKFHSDLDDVLDRFNNQLEDVGKIYASISKKFSDR